MVRASPDPAALEFARALARAHVARDLAAHAARIVALPDRATTVSGEPVTSLCQHKGLIRGVVVVGARQDGAPITAHRFWYPCGRMTPGRAGQHDLEIG